MAYQNIVNVIVSLQTTASQRASFGTQLFIGTHAWFRERVRSYSSLTAAAEDFPSTSNEYKALSAVFAQSPQPQTVKVGRRAATTTLTPTGAVVGKTYSVKVEVNGGAFVTASYTVGGVDTQQTICTAIKTALEGNAPIAARITATVVGTGANAVLTIVAKTASDEYAISNLTELTASFAPTETAAQVKAAIDVVDNGYYFITASDHTEAFVLAMAIEAESAKKMYITSSQSETVLAAIASPATDTFGKLKELGYYNVATFYHQTADTTFPECAYIGKFSISAPGVVQWAIKSLAGVAPATALNGGTTAVPLSQTQINNLAARNSNTMITQRGLNVVIGGKVVAGEWIDVVISRDYIKDETEAALFDLMYNQPKIPFDNSGIASIQAACYGVWDRVVSKEGSPNILDSENPYSSNFPTAQEVSFADKANRVYKADATLYLSGAIYLTELTVNLTYYTE